ncbi:uncharacterized protein TRIADDRAFT_61800 [Trichoplax adhaerens]|uniref:CCDC66 domain-containing protein n=1 Tax=Trichoplax adhaerens TaxID=10228 RepID=B3SC02_TRIAD|nr:hypothetical protein TRIADDRAFT_61800 [Trichoplax adhaerens]EDV19722.1 hypothetical protein TRIADDRAFT_61800 [Trichoplax adhaerens]|eukprot:XP_002117746.1 hypothetical protein TRIADDRAFT_61800 [Trichoplax adhaerens]
MLSPLAKGLGTWDGQVVIDAKELKKAAHDVSLPILPSLLASSEPTRSEREIASYGISKQCLKNAVDDHISLPRTFATRKGALLLFTGPEDLLIDYKRPEFPVPYTKNHKALPRVNAKDIRKTFERSSQLTSKTSPTLNKRRNFLKLLPTSDWDAIDKFNFPGIDSNYYLKGIQSRLSHQSKIPLNESEKSADEIINEYLSEEVLAYNQSSFGKFSEQDEADVDVIANNSSSKELDEVALANDVNGTTSKFYTSNTNDTDISHGTSTRTIWQSESCSAEIQDERCIVKPHTDTEHDWYLEDEISDNDLFSAPNLILIRGSQRVWSPPTAVARHQTSFSRTASSKLSGNKNSHISANFRKNLLSNSGSKGAGSERSQHDRRLTDSGGKINHLLKFGSDMNQKTYSNNINKQIVLEEFRSREVNGDETEDNKPKVKLTANDQDVSARSSVSLNSDDNDKIWANSKTAAKFVPRNSAASKQLDQESTTNVNSHSVTTNLDSKLTVSEKVHKSTLPESKNNLNPYLMRSLPKATNIKPNNISSNAALLTNDSFTDDVLKPLGNSQLNETEIDKKLAKLADIGRLRASSVANDLLLDGNEALSENENCADKIFGEAPTNDVEVLDKKIKFVPLRNVRERSKSSAGFGNVQAEHQALLAETDIEFPKTQPYEIDRPDSKSSLFNNEIQSSQEDSKSDDKLNELKSIARDLLIRKETTKSAKLKIKTKKRRRKKVSQDVNERKQSWVKIAESMESIVSSKVMQNTTVALKTSSIARNSMTSNDSSNNQDNVNNDNTETIPVDVSLEPNTREPITLGEAPFDKVEFIAAIESDDDGAWKASSHRRHTNKREEKKLSKEYEKMLKEREKEKQKMKKDAELRRKRGDISNSKPEDNEVLQNEIKDPIQDADAEIRKKTKEQREAKRLADAERRRLEVQRKRAERKELEARQAEEEKRVIEEREENERIMKEKLAEMQRLKDLERRQREEKEKMDAVIKERQLEQEREAEALKQKLAEEEIQRLLRARLQQQKEEEYLRKEMENRKLQEEEQRIKEAEEKNQRELENKIRQVQAAKKRENEMKDQAKRRLKRLAEERQKAADIEKQRALILAKQEQNVVLFNELKKIMYGQGLTRAWLFSYFVHVPRHLWELPMGYSKDKRKIPVKFRSRKL